MQFSSRGYRGVTTSPHHLASDAGLLVLKDGGTAVEACVTIAATLAVAYPHMTGIGGDGFWLIREPGGHIKGINGCGAAAREADLSLYPGQMEIPRRGPLAANTVAGTISSWQTALAGDVGTLSLARLLRDAIDLAEEGVAVTRGGAEIAASKHAELISQPGAYRAIFTGDGAPLQENDRLRQPALGRTLRELAKTGLGDFYNGMLARSIAADLTALGSPVSLADLKAHQATTTTPLSLQVSGAQLYNSAPPTQGIASLLILALFDRLNVREGEGFAHLHGLIEATKQAFIIRDAHVGDPTYMTLDPQSLLDDQAQLDALAARIDTGRALPWPHVAAQGDTTWFGAADGRGQVVSCIQSTYFEFGSGLVLPQTGIVWHNRGSGFRLAPDGWNALKPGRQPFHTLNPALAVFDDGRVMAYGTMGGEGQPQTQAAIFSRYAWYDCPLQEAITRPRWLLGRTWGDDSTNLKLEGRVPGHVVSALKAAGHDIELVSDFTALMGHAGAIVLHPNGLREGATDPRSDGASSAW